MARFAHVALLLVALLSVPCAVLAQKPENSTQVCENPTSKTDAEDDDYFDVCLEGAAFEGKKSGFNFNSAYLKKTTFTDVTFEEGTDFTYAFWEDVTFTKCTFKGDVNFDQALMQNVAFTDCTFESRAFFTQNTIDSGKFVDCTFEKGATFDLVDISDTTFTGSSFEGDETLFDRAGVKTMSFEKTKFDELRFSFLKSSEISFDDCEIGTFSCHEELDDGEFVKRRAEFDDLSISNTKIGEVKCDQTIFRGTTISKTEFGKGTHDFSKSTFGEINVSGAKEDGCAELDFSESTMESGEFKGNDVCKMNFKEAEVGEVKGIDYNDDSVNIEGTVLPGDKVGDKCCVDFCEEKKCLCDIKSEPTDGCPMGTSKTNPNLDPSDDPKCFPASATVELEDGSVVPMSHVAVGDSVKIGFNQFSRVFMFTHKQPGVASEYVELETATGQRLVLTGGHFIYADGSLVAAASVAPGAKLRSGDGSLATVVGTRRLSGEWGLFNPQTIHGDIVVDGIVTSTYTTAVEPSLAHIILAPLRALFKGFGDVSISLENGADSLLGVLPIGV